MTSRSTLRTSSFLLAMVGVAGLAAAGPAFGQDGGQNSPLDAAATRASDRPMTAVTQSDNTPSARVIQLLSGSWESPAKGDQPALRLNAAPVNIAGLDHVAIVEITRADAPWAPFRVMFLQAYSRQGGTRLRQYDFAPGSNLREVFAAVWAAPESMPKVDAATLDPNLDMPLNLDADGFRGQTTQPFPTTRDGAIEMTAGIELTGIALTMADAGFDAEGKQVWGTPAGQPIAFRKVERPPVQVQRFEGGLVAITLVPAAADAPKLNPGGELTAHYTGWLTSGLMFDSSRQAGREPFRVRIPGSLIAGWNVGLKDIAKGQRMRLIVPPDMGYGASGRGRIPPSATLVFDVEALNVDNSQPQTQQPGMPVQVDRRGEPVPQPANPHGSAPIGNPPTNAQPEKPK